MALGSSGETWDLSVHELVVVVVELPLLRTNSRDVRKVFQYDNDDERDRIDGKDEEGGDDGDDLAAVEASRGHGTVWRVGAG